MCCANLPQFLVKCCRHLENFHLYREDPGNYAQGCSDALLILLMHTYRLPLAIFGSRSNMADEPAYFL